MATIPVLLTELVATVSEATNLSTFREVYRAAGFLVDSWRAGGGFHDLTVAFSRGMSRLSDVIQEIAQGGFLEHARGQWLTLLAKSWFGLTRREASYAYQTLRLTSAPGSPPYTITPGQIWASTDPTNPSAKRFNGTTGGVLASGITLDITIKAESPGAAYNVSTGTVTTMVTQLAGVTCSNIAVVTEALDEETDTELRTRCTLRWSTLAAQAPGAMYEFWSLTESDGETARAGVTRAYADIDNPEGAGTVHVYLAGPTGSVDAGVVSDVDADLQPRRGVSTILTTSSATELEIVPTGTVWFSGVLKADAEAEAYALLDAMIAALPIGGNVIGSDRGVFADEIEDTIREATGVVRAKLTSGDHTLTATQVATADWTNILFEAA